MATIRFCVTNRFRPDQADKQFNTFYTGSTLGSTLGLTLFTLVQHWFNTFCTHLECSRLQPPKAARFFFFEITGYLGVYICLTFSFIYVIFSILCNLNTVLSHYFISHSCKKNHHFLFHVIFLTVLTYRHSNYCCCRDNVRTNNSDIEYRRELFEKIFTKLEEAGTVHTTFSLPCSGTH